MDTSSTESMAERESPNGDSEDILGTKMNQENGVVVVVDSGPIQCVEFVNSALKEEYRDRKTTQIAEDSIEESGTSENDRQRAGKLAQDVCEQRNLIVLKTEFGLTIKSEGKADCLAALEPELSKAIDSKAEYENVYSKTERNEDEYANTSLVVESSSGLDERKATENGGETGPPSVTTQEKNESRDLGNDRNGEALKDPMEGKEEIIMTGVNVEENKESPKFIILPVHPQGNRPEDMDETSSNEEMSSGIASSEFACEECGKCFTHLSSKKRHMLKHREGEIPAVVYQCLACSKTFQYNSSLKRHLKLHSEEVNGKAYTCQECSKAFMYATSLKRHLKTHSGKEIFPCPHCHRCFEYISSLKRHEKLHSEGKGFKCESCLKSFGYLSSLTRHQKIHQKCLSCDKCHKQFRFQKSYMKHLEEHNTFGENAQLCKIQVDGEETEAHHFEESGCMEVDESEETDNEGQRDSSSKTNIDMDTTKTDQPKEASEKKQADTTAMTSHSEVLDLQSAENHPFVKFVVSQNTLNIDQLEAFQAEQASRSSGNAVNVSAASSNITFAVVQADSNDMVENCTVVSEDGQSFPEGIVFVELDQNNKVTERQIEGLQASNLLQLLQAVEGFAVEQAVNVVSQPQEVDENFVAVKEMQQEDNSVNETRSEN